MTFLDQQIHPISWISNIGGGVAIAGTVVGWFPYIAAAVAVAWYLIQIWESRTIQHWLENRRMVQKAKRIARLKAKEKVIVAKLEAMEKIRQARVDARDRVEIARVEAEKMRIQEETRADKS